MNSEKTGQKRPAVGTWVSAFRLRTLPLSLSCIGMGGFLAAADHLSRWPVLLLCVLTTLFLQILSNLANDYGDSQHGADSVDRQGPKRAVQAGHISASQMKAAIGVFSLLSLVSGIALLWIALGTEGIYLFLFFLLLGLASIWAAISYTNGKKPYGYAGLGDISVFFFFGWVGVMGTYFLQTQRFFSEMLLPASTLGFFSAAVLNVNNIRDIASDELAGKRSLPVRLGPTRARRYHWFLLVGGILCAVLFVLQREELSLWKWLFVAALPLVLYNGREVQRRQAAVELDPLLKQMAMSTLIFVLLFGVGLLLSR
ncbi:1,4-dihydroxy-2-naphthoate polyprenyltransferase [Nibribacter ruber]|uniref:1,4-dihydroxy-2-naphthoate octaprenyltransferase n=1 Tax=Nibribacter ruber TaxID=2698458 RepID=A0A6P1NYJ0_9BACT|nr:1,4-dihydroxy-2-naphthoate polyprenyltransferase [Nibribacter ruber]QHL87065.1 1,4-dihydroxy-2-naphthoate polyprenyltransferase [Nibribacter ruber]